MPWVRSNSMEDQWSEKEFWEKNQKNLGVLEITIKKIIICDGSNLSHKNHH